MHDPVPVVSHRRDHDARGLLLLSVLLGLVFAGSWLGYAAATAEDGRRLITDWLDPMLPSATADECGEWAVGLVEFLALPT